MKLPFRVTRKFRIIAHRGASAYAPENTAVAFKLAAEMGAKEFELDVQLTLDDEIVICHEPSLEKYGYGGLVIGKMKWGELSQLDMGSWFSPFLFRNARLLRLSDLFNEYEANIIYHIEAKSNSMRLSESLYKTISNHNLQDSVVITSFSYDTLRRIKSLSSRLRLGWLVHDVDLEVIQKGTAINLFQICPRADLLTREKVDMLHAAALEVRAWGINGTREEILSLIGNVIDFNCDGVTINWPDWIIHGEM